MRWLCDDFGQDNRLGAFVNLVMCELQLGNTGTETDQESAHCDQYMTVWKSVGFEEAKQVLVVKEKPKT